MVKADIELLIAALQRLRSELDQRAISTHKITSLLDDMDHVLANLLAWEAAGTLEGNRDTKVFVDALNQYFNDLVIMLDDQSQPV